MKRAQPGFTLLELMLVVAIAGVLAAIAIPAMGNFIRNSRITSAANDVMAGFHFTRSEAIKRRVQVTLCTSANSLAANPTCAASALLTGWIAFVDTNQSGQVDVGEAVLMQHEAMNAQITARSSISPFAVTYLLNGFALNATAPAQLVLCDERGNTPSGGELSAARGILVSVTGRAGVSRNLDEIQDLLDTIGVDVGGCEAS
jgi:type IV fimbrial biogenesis protein FimT